MPWFSNWFSSSSKDEDTSSGETPANGETPASSETPPSSGTPPSISSDGQLNRFAMPHHPVADAHLGGTGQQLRQDYADHPAVVALSNHVGDKRVEHSNAHPEASDKDVIHHVQRQDAQDQFDAAAQGKLDSQEATDLPASLMTPYVHSLVDADKRPETLGQASDALATAVIGAGSQMAFGDAPGNPFSGGN